MDLCRPILMTRSSRLARRLLLLLALLVATSMLPATASRATASDTPPGSPPGAVVRDARFGLNGTASANLGDPADRAGAGWSRTLFWWSELQKTGPGELDLFATDQDAHVNAEVGRGRELVGAVLNTPPWASSNGTRNGVPKNLHLAWDHPDNHWGQLMRRLAKHYRGRIDTWIIWNEVDIRAGPWQTWDGSPEEYIQLLRVAYHAIKAGNPEATVLPFGAAWWYDRGEYLTRMLDILAGDSAARAANHYFDKANLHLYSRADDIPQVISWYREQLAARGMAKPIWVAEMNAIPYDDPVWPAPKANFRATLDEQASYVIQAFASYVGLGIERVSVNRIVDGTDFEAGGEPFGLLRNNGTTRPAFTAYQVATRYFAGTSEASVQTEPSGLTRVVMKKDGERVTVLWNMRPAPLQVALEADGSRALRVTKYGETVVLDAQDGRYELRLAPATNNSNEHDPADFVVGGDPIILVERSDGDLGAAHRPLEVAPQARKR